MGICVNNMQHSLSLFKVLLAGNSLSINKQILEGLVLKKTLALSVALTLAVSLSACGSKDNTKDTSGNAAKDSGTSKKTALIVATCKNEIATQWKEAGVQFAKENPDLDVQIYNADAGGSVNAFDKLTNSGKVAAVACVEPGTIETKYKGIGVDLSNEKWVAQTNQSFYKDGKVVGFPFAIEGFGFIYNKALVEKAVGGKFDPYTINTRDKLKALLEQVKKSGIKYPVAYQTEPWSLGNHYISNILNQGKPEEIEAQLASGKFDLFNNPTFNGLLDTLDMMTSSDYNYYGSKPLAATYDQAHLLLATGETAFMFNGNWAWQNIEAELKKAGKTSEYGFLAIPVDNNPENRMNNSLVVGPTQVIIVNSKATAAEQEAGKRFLNWIALEKSGQEFLVTKAQIVSAFKNTELQVSNPLGQSITTAIKAGKTIPFTTNYVNPGEYANKVGPMMQKYVDKKASRAELAKAIIDTHVADAKARAK